MHNNANMGGWSSLLAFAFLLLIAKLTNGELIDSTAESDVQNAATEILGGAGFNAVAACFANEAGGTFTGVETYTYYGSFEGVVEFEIEVGQTGIALQNNDLNFVGTAGLMCYKIDGSDYKVCAAYYTPFDDIFNDNQFNIKVYEQSATNNDEIFKHMLSDSAAWFDAQAGNYVLRSEYGIEMRAVMDDEDKATMALFVDSSNVNPFLGPDLNYGCDFQLITKQCWRECDANNPGWQWTTQDCRSIEDCGDPNQLTPDSECFIDGPW